MVTLFTPQHGLEVGYFATEEARKFEAECRGYLIPGWIHGQELAPEVSKWRVFLVNENR